MPTTEWKKIPRETRLCACGCGEFTTGTKRKMYARPYCKLKAYLERKKDPNFVPASKYNPNPNPLRHVMPFVHGKPKQEGPKNWWKERFGGDKDLSSASQGR